MSKNILVLTGSPRKKGNSEAMADAFIRGALAAGHQAVKFQAGRKKIAGCMACDTCFTKGTPCSVRDDFAELEPLLEKADVLVFCTPVYWSQKYVENAIWPRTAMRRRSRPETARRISARPKGTAKTRDAIENRAAARRSGSRAARSGGGFRRWRAATNDPPQAKTAKAMARPAGVFDRLDGTCKGLR